MYEHFGVNFNVSFNNFLEQSSCAFSWINNRRDNIKMHGTTVEITTMYIGMSDCKARVLSNIQLTLSFSNIVTEYLIKILRVHVRLDSDTQNSKQAGGKASFGAS